MDGKDLREVVLIIYIGLYKNGTITKEQFDMIQERLDGGNRIENTFEDIKRVLGW